MERQDYIKLFRRIYPESPILGVWEVENGIIIYTEHSGFCDYFAVSENSVSCAYNSLEEAKKSVY